MTKETKIELIGSGFKRQKPNEIRLDANNCIKGYVDIKGIFDSQNLSEKMFRDAPTLYLNPTEILYLSDIIVPNERFATVLSSGDFAIEGSFHGARDILTFDINKYQYYIAALKLKALQNMSYDDYIAFLGNSRSESYLSSYFFDMLKETSENDYSLYAFISEIIKHHEMEKVYRKFVIFGLKGGIPELGPIIAGKGPVEIDYVLSTLFQDYKRSDVFRTISGMDADRLPGSYLENEDSYRNAQESIKETNIKHAKVDLSNLKDYLDKSKYTKDPDFKGFSGIYLSNIPEYINGEKFSDIVKNQLMPLLKDDGVIQYCIQGLDPQLLTEIKLLDDVPYSGEIKDPKTLGEILQYYQTKNATDGLHILKSLYKTDLIAEKSLAHEHNDSFILSNKDTFVRIRKK